jgi:hypothetical protein
VAGDSRLGNPNARGRAGVRRKSGWDQFVFVLRQENEHEKEERERYVTAEILACAGRALAELLAWPELFLSPADDF